MSGLSPRALLGALMLVAFPAVLALLFGGLVVAQVLLAVGSIGEALRWAIVIVPAGWVLGRGLRLLVSPARGPVPGVSLTEAAHPELWGLVRRLAAVAGTQPPDEVRLTDEPNASVEEDTRLLGLVSSHRRMLVGAPVLVVLREDQLAAVLTHELAHYGAGDTRLAGLAYRGRRALIGTVSALDRTDLVQRLLAWLLRGWLRLYLRVSSDISQRCERAADVAAARAAGSDATATALRELGAIQSSWWWFVDHHLVMGWDAGYLPADIFGGYAELLAATADRFDRIRRNPSTTVSPNSSHPPMADRVAAVEAIAAAAVVPVGQRKAAALLGDRTVLDAAIVSGLGPEADGKRRADWVTLAHVHGEPAAVAAATALLAAAARLTGRSGTLRTVLDVLDTGGIAELAGIRAQEGIGPRGRREQARPHVRDGLRAAVGLAMAGVGAATWVPDWPACARLAADDPHDDELPELIDAAVADRPDSTGLRALLDTVNVDLDRLVTTT